MTHDDLVLLLTRAKEARDQLLRAYKRRDRAGFRHWHRVFWHRLASFNTAADTVLANSQGPKP